MESAYTQASRKLHQIREKNQLEHQRRVNEVRSLNEDYSRIEQAMAIQGSMIAKRILEGNSTVDDIATTIKKLQKERSALLKALHLPETYLDDIYSCKACRDTGFTETGDRCQCLKKLIEESTLANANLTDFMAEQTFDRFDFSLFAGQPAGENGHQPLALMKHAYEKGLQFAETFDTTHANLLLVGPAGTGKTFLSGCIANYVLARGKSVYYQTAFTLFDMLEKLKFGKLSGEELEQAEGISRYLYDVDLLIIDDVGTEYVSGYSAAAMFDLINTRLMRSKSVILSSNLTLQALEQVYSHRLFSRIMGGYTVIPFIGKDLRMKDLKFDF
ncbi:MAG: ATP-binding protein [Clostridia bacterium]|nr:ATP-binding protein [Clostridia bacterium]